MLPRRNSSLRKEGGEAGFFGAVRAGVGNARDDARKHTMIANMIRVHIGLSFHDN
jgi:hypothetical protein